MGKLPTIACQAWIETRHNLESELVLGVRYVERSPSGFVLRLGKRLVNGVGLIQMLTRVFGPVEGYYGNALDLDQVIGVYQPANFYQRTRGVRRIEKLRAHLVDFR